MKQIKDMSYQESLTLIKDIFEGALSKLPPNTGLIMFCGTMGSDQTPYCSNVSERYAVQILRAMADVLEEKIDSMDQEP